MERIYRFDGENIIVVVNNLEITADLVEENRAACRRLMNEMEGPVVILVDYREVKANFSEIVKIMQGNREGRRQDLNQRAFTIFVGTDQLINMYRDSMRHPEQGGVQIPYFADMEAAVAAARLYIEQGGHLDNG